jgi:hypothetical protein
MQQVSQSGCTAHQANQHSRPSYMPHLVKNDERRLAGAAPQPPDELAQARVLRNTTAGQRSIAAARRQHKLLRKPEAAVLRILRAQGGLRRPTIVLLQIQINEDWLPSQG